MNFLCVLIGILCIPEPTTMPVHVPPKISESTMVAPKMTRPFLVVPPWIWATSFPRGCNVQPPKGIAKHYVQAARTYRSGAAACELARQGKAESNFNPKAVSPAGAIGIAQFLPRTARAWGIDPWNIRSSIFGQARFLRWCRARWPINDRRGFRDQKAFGLGCYEWGLGNMRKNQRKNGWTTYREARPYFPRSTNRYIKIIVGGPTKAQ